MATTKDTKDEAEKGSTTKGVEPRVEEEAVAEGEWVAPGNSLGANPNGGDPIAPGDEATPKAPFEAPEEEEEPAPKAKAKEEEPEPKTSVKVEEKYPSR